jgi:hypothetical protein
MYLAVEDARRGGSAGDSLGAARLRHRCIPDGLAPPRIAALAGGLGPAVLGHAERCGLRPPVGATGAAPATGAVPAIALGPAHDRIRRRLGDVRPNTLGSPTTTTGSRHGALTAPLAATALQRRSDPAGRDGPRRGDTIGPKSTANPLAERDRA